MEEIKSENAVKQFITFMIGIERYAIELRESKEIVLPPEIKNVPNTSQDIVGVINLRGRVIPVLNFKNILNIDKKKQTYSKDEQRLIISNIEGILSAFVVDKMMGVVNINLNNLSEKKEEMTKKKFIKSINAENNRLISIIDLKSIIDAKKEAAYN